MLIQNYHDSHGTKKSGSVSSGKTKRNSSTTAQTDISPVGLYQDYRASCVRPAGVVAASDHLPHYGVSVER